MILTCPECAMRYLVPDTSIGPLGRQVRCANCRHSWHQDAAEGAVDAAPRAVRVTPAPTPPPALSSDAMDRSNRPLPSPAPTERAADAMAHRPPFKPRRNPLKAWSWIAGAVCLVLVALGALALTAGRAPLARLMGVPATDPTPLVFVDDVSERGTFGANRPMLIVTAKVLNTSGQAQPIPAIEADGIDANDRVVFSWTIPPPQPRIAPGERVAFSSGQSGAPETIRRVELSFNTPGP